MLLQLWLGPAVGDTDPLSQHLCSRYCFDKKRELFTTFFSDVSKVPIRAVLRRVFGADCFLLFFLSLKSYILACSRTFLLLIALLLLIKGGKIALFFLVWLTHDMLWWLSIGGERTLFCRFSLLHSGTVQASGYGGAVQVSAYASTLKASGCSEALNVSAYGGAIHAGVCDGVVHVYACSSAVCAGACRGVDHVCACSGAVRVGVFACNTLARQLF